MKRVHEHVQTPARRVSAGTLVVLASVATYFLARSSLGEMTARALSLLVFASGFWAAEVLPLFATAFVLIALEIVFLATHGGLAGDITRWLERAGFEVVLPQGYSGIPARAFLEPLSRDIVVLFLGGFLLSAGTVKSGLDRVLAARLLGPFTRSPLTLLIGLVGVTAFFSMWMSNTAAAAMMLAISAPIVHAVPKSERFRTAIVLAIPFGANIGGIGTPIGTPPNAIAYGELRARGFDVSFIDWMQMAVPLELALLALVCALLYFRFRPSAGLVLERPRGGRVLSRQAWTTLVVLIATVGLWLTADLHGVQPGAVSLLASAALCALRVIDGTDLRKLDWDVLILLWGGLSLGVALEVSGFTDLLASFDLQGLPGGAWTVGIVIVLLGTGLSTFMSNTATAAILVPAAMALSLTGIEGFAALAALSCSFAMAMPVSTPPNALAFASGEIEARTMMRTGGTISVLAAVLLLVVYRLFSTSLP